jgi:hypothetical protein
MRYRCLSSLQGIVSSSGEARLRARIETGEQRIVTMTLTARPARKNLWSFSVLWRLERGQ